MTERQVPSGGLRYETNVVTPTDRVRWGPIWAGLFTALSTWFVLTVLGAAIGLSTYDRGETAQGYGTGAAIWGVISAIIAFIFGGWIAARTAAVRGERNGLINGFMVWAVGVPILTFLLGSSALSMLGSAMRSGYGPQATPAGARTVPGAVDRGDLSMTPAAQQSALSAARGAAWWTLVALLLGLGSAAFGGWLGARNVGERTYGEHRGGISTEPRAPSV